MVSFEIDFKLDELYFLFSSVPEKNYAAGIISIANATRLCLACCRRVLRITHTLNGIIVIIYLVVNHCIVSSALNLNQAYEISGFLTIICWHDIFIG